MPNFLTHVYTKLVMTIVILHTWQDKFKINNSSLYICVYIGHQRSVALVPYHTPLQSAYNQLQPAQSVCDQSLQYKQTAFTVPNAAAKSSEQTLTEKEVVTLLNLLHNHSDKWFEIGLELGFAPSELNLIRSMPILLNDAPVCYLTKLLSQWVQWPTAEHPTKPTVGMLCKALRTSLVGLGSLADKVQEDMKSLRASKLWVSP